MRIAISLTAFVALIALSPLAGCGSNGLHEAGTSCGSDGDCAAGLSCLGIGNGMSGSCMTIARSCTKACATDLDCLAVGSNYKCLPTCTDAGTCTQTRSATD